MNTFIPHPGVILGPGGSKNLRYEGQKSVKMTEYQYRQLEENSIFCSEEPLHVTKPLHVDQRGPGMTPGCVIEMSNTSFPIAWDMF